MLYSATIGHMSLASVSWGLRNTPSLRSVVVLISAGPHSTAIREDPCSIAIRESHSAPCTGFLFGTAVQITITVE